jgi:ABC-type nitrate/sulfonate/bicarbonate transport system substrate-binding protein
MRRALLATAAMLSGYWGVAGTATGAELEDVSIVIQPAYHEAAVYMAKDQGYFEQEGLNVTFHVVANGPAGAAFFKNGQDGKPGFGEFVTGGSAIAISLAATTDYKFRVVAPLQRGGKAEILAVRPGIKTPQDLIGKKIAITAGSTGRIFFDRYLAAAKIPTNKVTVVNLDQPTMIAAISRGDIDAFFSFEPAGQQAFAATNGEVHVLANAEDYHQDFAMLGTWSRIIEQKPAMVRKVLAAIVRGEAFAKAHPDVAQQYYVEHFKQNPKTVKYTASLIDLEIKFDPLFEKWTKITGEFMESEKQIKNFDFDKLVDTAPLKAVDPKLVTIAR